MVTSKLSGGLGNQLFQIAAGYSLSVDNNVDFSININECDTQNQGFVAKKYENTLYKNIIKNSDIICDNVYAEIDFSYNEIPYTKDMCILGYFQSEKYFKHNTKKIFDLFDIRNVDLNNLRDNKEITSVHIRRGDYLSKPNIHPTCSIEYYESSMNMFNNTQFLFFSDDINWCRETFKGDNYIFSDNNDELLDFEMMSSCDNHIIANSTFSWWSAYLNPNMNKKIISPKKWFGDYGPENVNDLLPNNWVKM